MTKIYLLHGHLRADVQLGKCVCCVYVVRARVFERKEIDGKRGNREVIQYKKKWLLKRERGGGDEKELYASGRKIKKKRRRNKINKKHFARKKSYNRKPLFSFTPTPPTKKKPNQQAYIPPPHKMK